MNVLSRWYDSIQRFAYALEDRAFEAKYGLRFGGVIAPMNLGAAGENIRHANSYHAVWCRNIRVLMAEAFRRTGKFEYFVDIGSGKGKACIYAFTRGGFEKIVGVEFSENLVSQANINKKRVGAKAVEFVCSDAADYKLPDGRCLVFMFNPFDEVILQKFVERNFSHFRRNGSFIAYANDVHRKVLIDVGLSVLFRDEFRSISLHGPK